MCCTFIFGNTTLKFDPFDLLTTLPNDLGKTLAPLLELIK